MAEAIEVVAMPAEDRLEPFEERHARISVVAADAEDADVERDEGVDERAETKPAVGRDEDRGADDAGDGLEPPGEAVVTAATRTTRRRARSRGEAGDGAERCGVHCAASSTASRMAAIMLSGRAMPFPAISNAVP